MNIANVTSRFALLAGLDSGEVFEWKTVIDDACGYVQSIVTKPEPDAADRIRIETLCAVYAYRLYSLCNCDSISSFTAGDVKIASSADDGNKAEKLWREYLLQCSDLVENNNFLFGAVM